MKGTYCLLINVKSDCRINIGSLGKLKFDKGCYVYVGSALNNLEKRIARHLRDKKKKHWHIDYLLASRKAAVEQVLCKESKEKQECKTAQFLLCRGQPVAGFGSSDCKCKSHLFRIDCLGEIDWHANGFKSVL